MDHLTKREWVKITIVPLVIVCLAAVLVRVSPVVVADTSTPTPFAVCTIAMAQAQQVINNNERTDVEIEQARLSLLQCILALIESMEVPDEEQPQEQTQTDETTSAPLPEPKVEKPKKEKVIQEQNDEKDDDKDEETDKDENKDKNENICEPKTFDFYGCKFEIKRRGVFHPSEADTIEVQSTGIVNKATATFHCEHFIGNTHTWQKTPGSDGTKGRMKPRGDLFIDCRGN